MDFGLSVCVHSTDPRTATRPVTGSTERVSHAVKEMNATVLAGRSSGAVRTVSFIWSHGKERD